MSAAANQSFDSSSRQPQRGVVRHFAGWNSPFLPQVIEFLIANYSKQNPLPVIDLSDLIVVFPGEHAVLRTIELLAQTAATRNAGLIPPTVITIGTLADRFIPAGWTPDGTTRAANRFERRIIWSEVLRTAGSGVLPVPIPADSEGKWIDAAGTLERLTETLGAEGIEIDEIARIVDSDHPGEARRWLDLDRAVSGYHGRLLANGLYDRNNRRKQALAAGICSIDRPVVLAGCSDLNRITRDCLAQAVSGGNSAVAALIHAPDDLSGSFDEFGAIVEASWIDFPIQLADNQIKPAQSSVDQALAVISELSEFGVQNSKPDSLSQATVTVCEESLLPFVREALADADLPAYFIGGQDAAAAPPFRLLTTLSRLLRTGSFADCSTLARHPDILGWLVPRHPETFLPAALDVLFENHLPAVVDAEFMRQIADAPPDRENRQQKTEQQAARAIIDLLGLVDLLRPSGTLTQIGANLRVFLTEIYSAVDVSSNPLLRKALPVLTDLIADIESAAPAQNTRLPVDIVIDLLLEAARSEKFQLTAPDESVIITGWLDLAHDDAPLAVVCGFNDSAIPAPFPPDPFLPDSLRRKLGMGDNLRRLARDSYLLASVAASKTISRFILGRESHDHAPLLPSRLLLRNRGAALAERLIGIFSGGSARPEVPGQAVKSQPANWGPAAPPPLPFPIESISVSGFKVYLQCPYLFYLKHVLKLESHDDHALELDPRRFGSLIHQVLADFGTDPAIKDSCSDGEIAEYCKLKLDKILELQYGRFAHPAVQIQFENARNRLNAFAEAQARHRAAGWHIEAVELQFKLPIQLNPETAGLLPTDRRGPMIVSGRIDRIDRHESSNEIAVFDYKTGDRPQTPEKAHRTRNAWTDLQLPLYSAHIDSMYPDQTVKLGYIVLAAEKKDIKFSYADWNGDELGQAFEKAREIAGRVRAEQFWPRNLRIKLGEYNEFAKLLELERFSAVETEELGDPPAAESNDVEART